MLAAAAAAVERDHAAAEGGAAAGPRRGQQMAVASRMWRALPAEDKVCVCVCARACERVFDT